MVLSLGGFAKHSGSLGHMVAALVELCARAKPRRTAQVSTARSLQMKIGSPTTGGVYYRGITARCSGACSPQEELRPTDVGEPFGERLIKALPHIIAPNSDEARFQEWMLTVKSKRINQSMLCAFVRCVGQMKPAIAFQLQLVVVGQTSMDQQALLGRALPIGGFKHDENDFVAWWRLNVDLAIVIISRTDIDTLLNKTGS